ncbi:hypothetical protein VTI28DRAFT_3017 [Corynascus sepedonium]
MLYKLLLTRSAGYSSSNLSYSISKNSCSNHTLKTKQFFRSFFFPFSLFPFLFFFQNLSTDIELRSGRHCHAGAWAQLPMAFGWGKITARVRDKLPECRGRFRLIVTPHRMSPKLDRLKFPTFDHLVCLPYYSLSSPQWLNRLTQCPCVWFWKIIETAAVSASQSDPIASEAKSLRSRRRTCFVSNKRRYLDFIQNQQRYP